MAVPRTDQITTRELADGGRRFVLRLDHLHPDRDITPDEVTRDAVALVASLAGHDDVRFALQLTADPTAGGASTGELQIHLVVTVEHGSPERVSEVADDLLDMLAAPPLRWAFSVVTDDASLDEVLTPVTPTHLAEIARREEPAAPTTWNGKAGFNKEPGPLAERPLWSMWTLGQPATDLHRLAAVLLSQEAPVAIRILLQSTALTDAERSGIENLSRIASSQVGDGGLLRASLSTLEALLYLRPLFEVRCIVASEQPISRSLLSALGHTISEPSRHGRTTDGVLEGGFAILRGTAEAEVPPLRQAFDELSPTGRIPGLAPTPLRRLRSLMGVWEASNVFRLPITDDDFPGVTTLDTPELEPPLDQLPRHGRLLGRLVSHGRPAVRLDREERFRHLYVSGQTGTGKSTLLQNLALQDVEDGAGVAVLDPHGDLVEAMLRSIPEDRIDDVVLVDPGDPEAVVGVNLLEAETPVQAGYVVSELCAMFYDLFDPQREGIVGPRFETMLRQSALLLMAHPDQPSSFLDISTLFIDGAVRKELSRDLDDPILNEFWRGEMQMSRSREWQEVVSWFRSKFEIFRTSPAVRNVVGQASSTMSFSDVLGEQRILLVNLSKGLLGEYNSSLLGYIVFTRLWAAALERASMPMEERGDFFVYVDEFQNMTSDSLPQVLSEARKYRVGMTLANQFFTQVPEQTRDAIMGNVSNRITLRLGPRDAEPFASWLGQEVHADDLLTLPNHVAIGALSDRGVPLDPVVLQTEQPPQDLGVEHAEAVRARSREQWARPVAELDEDFFGRWAHIKGSIAAASARKKPKKSETPFLDGWLDKRQQLSPTPAEPSADGGGESDDGEEQVES